MSLQKRTLVIGDIHSRLASLKGVLDLAQYDPQTDRLICIGDYIDSGNEAYEVVEFLLACQDKTPLENIYLLGNHDKMFLDILEHDFEVFRDRKIIEETHWEWYSEGGINTYDSYIKRSDANIKRHLEHFYKKLKYYHIESNKLFVHAGFDTHLSIEASFQQNPDLLLWDRDLYKSAINDHSDKVIKFGGYDKIYIGHTPTFIYGDIRPKKRCNVINVDQGCKAHGKLSAWVDETDEWFQFIPKKQTRT